MHYLVYVSSASKKMSEEELTLLLEKARQNNERLGITGLMIYIDGNIIQMLEGEEEKVRAVYNRILSDPRHHGVLKLLDRPLDKRNFENWSMQFKSMSDAAAASIVGYNNLKKENFLAPSNPAVHPGLKIIETFCNAIFF
jgi:hypothetical protein